MEWNGMEWNGMEWNGMRKKVKNVSQHFHLSFLFYPITLYRQGIEHSVTCCKTYKHLVHMNKSMRDLICSDCHLEYEEFYADRV